MMRASSPEDEIERLDDYIYRLPASLPTISELKLEPWPTTPKIAESVPSISHKSQNDGSLPHASQGATDIFPPPPKSSTPKNSTQPFRITKHRHRSKSKAHLPSMKANVRFTSSNVTKARKLALEIQDETDHSRSNDLRYGRERSTLFWFCKRTIEPQPNEMLRKLRRLQFESAKRELVAGGMKSWEISALCLEGASGLRSELKADDVQ